VSKPSFTHGQWQVNTERQVGGWNGDIAITLPGGTIVAAAFARAGKPCETLANARLIAAAPELYNVLNNLYILREKVATSEKPTRYFEEMQRFWNMAANVLAKAEGREVKRRALPGDHR